MKTYTQPRQVLLEVVDHEEYRELDVTRDASGNVLNMEPIKGSETAFLRLKMPNGHMIRAEIPYEELDPILALMIPDFHGSSGVAKPNG